MNKGVFIILFLISFTIKGQILPEFSGQLTGMGSYSPQSTYPIQFAGLYIPEISQAYKLDSNHFLDYEASLNINGNVAFSIGDSGISNYNLDPYRVWLRYYNTNLEVRVGLQKITFGSAMILRPLMWFDQIDPRDPLQITNGVYGALGKYYFNNNANLWFWGLYGNTKTRGWDFSESTLNKPELGGRFQQPIGKGEIALSYHYRETDLATIPQLPLVNPYLVNEHRVGLDGKWDVGIGLWFEGSVIYRDKPLLFYTNQEMYTLGMDYTFGIGNGLTTTFEQLLLSLNEKTFQFENNYWVSSISFNYPLSLDDQLILFGIFDWETESFSLFLNYQHQFNRFTGYVMLYYLPENGNSLDFNSNITQNITGPGIRLMATSNH